MDPRRDILSALMSKDRITAQDVLAVRAALDDNEIALLQFVAEEAPVIHPALQPLIARARPTESVPAAAPAFGRRGLG